MIEIVSPIPSNKGGLPPVNKSKTLIAILPTNKERINSILHQKKKLVELLEETPKTRKQCVLLLREQIKRLQDINTSKEVVNFALIKGSLIYTQSIMIGLIYQGQTESQSVDDFKKAMVVYKEFLLDSVNHFKKNAFIPDSSSTDWFAPLR